LDHGASQHEFDVKEDLSLKAHDLITSSAFVVLKAANEFEHRTTAISQLWQTDFTYLEVLGWGWFYLSTILNDYGQRLQPFSKMLNVRSRPSTASKHKKSVRARPYPPRGQPN